MKSTLDSRTSEKAAREQAPKASVGADSEGSGTPRSWRQYIEQSMFTQEAEAEQKNAAAQAGPGVKEQAGAMWNRLARWAEENGKKVCSFAEVAWERLGSAAAAGREKLCGTDGWKKFSRSARNFRGVVARHPVSPLLYVTLLAVGIGVVAFQGSYARAFELEVNGQKVLVSSEDEANAILDSLSAGFDYEVDVSLSPVYASPDAISDAAEVEDALIVEMGAYVQTYAAAPVPAAEPDYIQAWAISVDGVELGCAADKSEFYRMLDEIAQPYIPANAVRYEFVEDVRVYPVRLPPDAGFDDLEPIREELSALRVEQAVYVVKKGDTFNAIAYSLGMKPNELSVLNPDVMVDKLWVDQELIIQQAVPRLSVVTVTNETYEEAVPSPVEYIETADLYVGDTKVKVQGEDGLALVNAEVTYINNVEQGREILESTTLKEPTTTYTYTGTTPRPKTASNGYFIWPVKGPITSNFGARNLWGSYNYHLGLDIGCATGTSIKAADGGTVVTAGWNSGGYGYLVVIRHDNGMLTYYAHNSSVLVKAGEKVYQGQVIAKAGMTGKADGPHCHFEIRVNGTSVNPRNYLS